eukprot:TRINITY_DN6757_c0_g1_i2.p1 TRINITY_DN6757_c0_g1~~TRINITY_DN6757_c0_g1_i2.p1  ORF type:complete len:209 (-),score=14.35 TRINITY_DN6757_c0_g1_i2:392-1018(-)
MWKRVSAHADYAPRFDQSLVVTPSNRVLMFGGMAEGWSLQQDLWELDVSTMKWTKIPTASEQTLVLKDHTAVYCERTQQMIIFGGKSFDKHSMNHVLLYSTETGAWKTLEPDESFPQKRHGHSAVIRNGKMYIMGGKRHTKNVDAIRDLWEFDTSTLVWKQIPLSDPSPFGLMYHSAVVHGKDMIIAGGFREGKPLTDVWTCDLGKHR